MCLLVILHISHKAIDSLKSTKSVPTLFLSTHKYIKRYIFEELVPSVSPLFKKKEKRKKAHEARARWHLGPLRQLINTRFERKKKYQKEEERNGQKQ